MTQEDAVEFAKELYGGNPAAAVLLLQSRDEQLAEIDRQRAWMALQLLDPANRPPEGDALARFLGVQRRPSASQRLRLVQGSVASATVSSECPSCKRESCEGQCRGNATGPFQPALELIDAPVTRFVVESIAVVGGITVLVGESGAGKTFVATGQAAAISDGRDWFGLATRRGSVAYVAYEGDALGLRLRALHSSGALLSDFYVLRATDPLSPHVLRGSVEEPSVGEEVLTNRLQDLAEQLRQAGRPPLVALYIDTIRASMTGSEDDSDDVSAYLRAIRRILATLPGAAGILVHHAGWQDGETKRKRERGSSAFRGNADSTLYVEVEEEDAGSGRASLVIRTLKTRDAERPAAIRAIRQRVDVAALDERGNQLTSCIVLPDPRTKVEREAAAAAAAGAADREVDLRVLRVIRDHPEATSRDRVRAFVKASKATVAESVARLLLARLITQGRRGERFALTPDGERLANEGTE